MLRLGGCSVRKTLTNQMSNCLSKLRWNEKRPIDPRTCGFLSCNDWSQVLQAVVAFMSMAWLLIGRIQNNTHEHGRLHCGPMTGDGWSIEFNPTGLILSTSGTTSIGSRTPLERPGSSSHEEWEQVSGLVSNQAPHVPERFELSRQAAERVAQAHHERREAHERRGPARTLAQMVEEVLGRGDKVPCRRMQDLAWLCFLPELRRGNISGSWEDLDLGLQARARAAIRLGLEEGTPTPIPDENEFPGAILAEARAFKSVLDDPEQSSWLNTERLNWWLPTAILALHGHVSELVQRCALANHEATLTILLNEAERELRAGHRYAARAHDIPADWCLRPADHGYNRTEIHE